jgi:hypothetical protein
MMSNKPHLHPHQKKRQASRTTRLFMAIVILAIFALVIALEATGHVVFRGRLILLRGVAGCAVLRELGLAKSNSIHLSPPPL